MLWRAGAKVAKPVFAKVLEPEEDTSDKLGLPIKQVDEGLVRAATLGAVALGDGAFVEKAQAYLNDASEAEYIAIRRFTASAEMITMIVGALSVNSCSAVSWAAPAMTRIEKVMVSRTLSPDSVATTPKSRPNGPTTRMNGAASRTPLQKIDFVVSVGT